MFPHHFLDQGQLDCIELGPPHHLERLRPSRVHPVNLTENQQRSQSRDLARFLAGDFLDQARGSFEDRIPQSLPNQLYSRTCAIVLAPSNETDPTFRTWIAKTIRSRI